MGYTRGVEIGTGGGVYAEVLCRNIPGLRLVCVDLWRPYDGYIDYTSVDYLEQDYRRAQELLAPWCVELIRKESMDALTIFQDGEFDFCYIDANHRSPWVDNDIYWWSKKVRSGGIVSGHDYSREHLDVMQAVERLAPGDFYVTSTTSEIPSWYWGKR
jgi:predicted O-methyltransferase YrrM